MTRYSPHPTRTNERYTRHSCHPCHLEHENTNELLVIRATHERMPIYVYITSFVRVRSPPRRRKGGLAKGRQTIPSYSSSPSSAGVYERPPPTRTRTDERKERNKNEN